MRNDSFCIDSQRFAAGHFDHHLMVGKMMKNPTTRIWLSDWVNWSNNQLPDDCYQLVRHGKWIASPDDKEDA